MMKAVLLLTVVIACCGALHINVERQGRERRAAEYNCTSGTLGGRDKKVGIVECNADSPMTVAGSETSVCGDGAAHYYNEDIDETACSRVVATSGIPDHGEVYSNKRNKNLACEKWSYMTLPLNPTKGTTFTESEMGPVGTAVSGAFFYNHKGNRLGTGDVAYWTEGPTFDDCNGHADKANIYHYHKIPVCIKGYDSCGLMGYYQDGFPVYGLNCTANDGGVLTSCYYLKEEGDRENTIDYEFDSAGYTKGECNLDEANGYDFDAGYAYVFTEAYPFIMPGYYGTTASAKCTIYKTVV